MSHTDTSTALHARVRKLMLEGFRASDIAEPLCSFEASALGSDVLAILEKRHATVAGVRAEGLLQGIVLANDLDGRPLGRQLHALTDYPILPCDTSFAELIPLLDKASFCLVSEWGEPVGVILREYTQKPPIRMWLFGVVTIVELFVSREIRRLYPDECWKKAISEGRLARAVELQKERARRLQYADLLDCLQLKDKADLLLRHPEAESHLEDFPSRSALERMIKQLESLRNNLAHAQDIITYDWDVIVEIARRLDGIVDRLKPESEEVQRTWAR